MSEESKKVVERIRASLPKLFVENKPVSRELIDARFRQSLFYAVNEAYKHADNGGKDPQELTEQLIKNDLPRQQFYREFHSGISVLIARESRQMDELNQLKIVEHAQGRRSALWRFASTLAVGFAILIIYAIADFCEIALPLSGIR
ncbi:hypothetical protein [Marinobacter sp. F4206]|uniref:hypothetical protein n=1 Tax=Marinobacter sp. F4206 TaxID=2861777 RepID=UPI001C5E1A69|nr:hypothetical protein [Marinobacter sp. F4206]MBW4933279.1 hypothetical protein [Marinobacter sp. F4206]